MANFVDLYSKLNILGLLEYGSTVPQRLIRETLGIVTEERMTQQEYDKANLAELEALTYVRDKLLAQGKYLAKEGAHYRVLLPSQNATQVASYFRRANKKYSRGIKLNKNTPREVGGAPDTTLIRSMAKLDSIKEEMERMKLLG